MASKREGRAGTLIAGEALERHRRVKINSSGQAEYADAGEAHDAVTTEAAASGEPVAVDFAGGPGSYIVTAAGAIALGAFAYGANDGKIAATSVGPPLCKLIGEASTADNDEIEVMEAPPGANPSAAIPDYSITWTANEPTAGSANTIDDGNTVGDDNEGGQAIADLTAKMNLLLEANRAHGIIAE